jgi:hypothetical protein
MYMPIVGIVTVLDSGHASTRRRRRLSAPRAAAP